MASAEALGAIFKAYDVRGIVPDELDEQAAYAIGVGFGRFLTEQGGAAPRLVVCRDMRSSGVGLAAALTAGAQQAGCTVTDLGLGSTDLLYFASGSLDAAGAMLTASHNPADYNGMKLCLPGARPIGEDSGLFQVRDHALEALAGAPAAARPAVEPEHRDLLEAFAEHVRSFIDLGALRPLHVVADTANGMGGLVAPQVFNGLPFSLDVLYGELDGTFPNHPADPIQEANLVDLREAILRSGADVGLAFDGDADRVFLVDELGVPLSGSLTTAIVAKAMLEKHSGATILYNCICSRTVREVIAENGGKGIRTRVGHSFIKGVMAESGAVFGGEHSGHYYFADNYRADSGIIAAMVLLELLCRSGTTLSELRRPFERYADSGEINSVVDDPQGALAGVEAYAAANGAELDHLDGLTADYPTWWFNLRPSNTEPLLRLNVEARTDAELERRVAEVLALVRG
ncbi:MAG TPA: phosphomannomutase/phosphoglucomutase [Acidimicrobiales bacterium]|nr:phosphomannomutase/phosphoglucomutase [Acidimicrobiales bacterium]